MCRLFRPLTMGILGLAAALLASDPACQSSPADPATPGFRLATTPTALQRQAFELLGVSHHLGVA